jgi:LuxR family transcriptional regulator, maltose regulon positive regulatory protein
MDRHFRITAPVPPAEALVRPRLLSLVAQRWDRPVTLVTGGPGLGKTTLLAHGMRENALDPRGDDHWLTIDRFDADATRLGRTLLEILGVSKSPAAVSADDVTEALWSRAPMPVCLVLDDAHALPTGSDGLALLAAVIESLPANAHVVLASRTEPGLPLARLEVTGSLMRVDPDMLRFDEAELREIADRRGLAPEAFRETGGWPALVALTATAGRALASRYLGEEVVGPLEAPRRRVLAVLVELGGADDDLMSAALGEHVDLAAALDGVPLIAVDASGWFRPHDLWGPLGGLRLDEGEATSIRRRAIRHHLDRGRFEEAFNVVATADLWDEAAAVIRASCLDRTRAPAADQLERWLARCPSDVRAGSPGLLAAGVLATLTDPSNAAGLLSRAMETFRDEGDADAELGAIAHLGRSAWWRQDLAQLAGLVDRMAVFVAAGHPVAAALDTLGRAVVADIAGDDAAVIGLLAGVPRGVLGPAWDPSVDWLRAAAHFGRGDLEQARDITRRTVREANDPIFRATLGIADLSAGWKLGLPTDVALRRGEALVAEVEASGAVQNIALAAASLSLMASFAGDQALARTHLDHARLHAAHDRPVTTVRLVLAEASLLLGAGDDEGAARLLAEEAARSGLDQSTTRRAWRESLCLPYVLLPETRATWDSTTLTGVWSHTRQLSAAVVAVRERTALTLLPDLPVGDVAALRARLHPRFVAELAVGLHEVGRPEGAVLLDDLGASGRQAVRDLSSQSSARARSARALLAAVPAMPRQPAELGVLGPLVVRRDGVVVDLPELRRERVRALLALLVERRTVPRRDAMATLWPDFDARAAANNLRVTLNHLLRVLEPERGDSEPAYLVRSDAQQLRLVTGRSLHLDVDEFGRLLAEAEKAEGDGTPSVALEAYLAAIPLWRGELHAGVADAPWLDLARERARLRFTTVSQRAADLSLACGDHDRADALARRVVELDPWAEAAHAVLVEAALRRDDRSAARAALDRCLGALDELEVPASKRVCHLARQLGVHDLRSPLVRALAPERRRVTKYRTAPQR